MRQHKKPNALHWDKGKSGKDFHMFVLNKINFYNKIVPQNKLISLISEEYDCSYASAFYRLKEWINKYHTWARTEWRGHNKHKVVVIG